MDDLTTIQAEEALLDLEEEEDLIALRSVQRKKKRLELNVRRAKLHIPESSQAKAQVQVQAQADPTPSPQKQDDRPSRSLAKSETIKVVDITSETDEQGSGRVVKEEDGDGCVPRKETVTVTTTGTSGKGNGNQDANGRQKEVNVQKDVAIDEKECRNLNATPVSQEQNASTVPAEQMTKGKTIDEQSILDPDPESVPSATGSTTNTAQPSTTQMQTVNQIHSTSASNFQMTSEAGLRKTSSAVNVSNSLRAQLPTPVVPAKRPSRDPPEKAAPKPSERDAKQPLTSSLHHEMRGELEEIDENPISTLNAEGAVARTDTATKKPSQYNFLRHKRPRPPPGHLAIGTAAFPPEQIQRLLNRFCGHVLDELDRQVRAVSKTQRVPRNASILGDLRRLKESQTTYTTYAEFSDDMRKRMSKNQLCQIFPDYLWVIFIELERRKSDWQKCFICCEAVTVKVGNEARREEIVDEWGKGGWSGN